jgi:hypothetical protein
VAAVLYVALVVGGGGTRREGRLIHEARLPKIFQFHRRTTNKLPHSSNHVPPRGDKVTISTRCCGIGQEDGLLSFQFVRSQGISRWHFHMQYTAKSGRFKSYT